MIFETNQPFNLGLTLECAQGHRWRPEWRHGGPWYSSVLDGKLVFVCQPDGAKGSLQFETDGDEATMEAKLRRQFRLDDNIDEIYHYLSYNNTEMAHLVERYQGLRIMRVDPWECLVFFILAVNASHEYTYQRMDKIAAQFAGKTTVANERYPFPGPATVGLPSGLEQLKELQGHLVNPRTGRPADSANVLDVTKARYIHEAAMRVHANNPNLDRLVIDVYEPTSLTRRESCRGAIRELRKLTGVGAKTAASVALFGLGYHDAFPVDSTILASLKAIYGPKYAGYVSQFLFALIRDHESDAYERRR